MPGASETDLLLVDEVARRHFGVEASDVQSLAGGEFSRAFALRASGLDYVVRLSAHDHAPESFAKDAFAGRRFASPLLPIPRVLATGRVGDEYFALSTRMPGRRLEEIDAATRQTLTPALLDVVEALGHADTRETTGYGMWDAAGSGEAPSWRAYLTGINADRATGYYHNWHALFRESFLERELYDAVFRRLLRLVDCCPEERALVHADLHFDNILGTEDAITGVLDWGNACYGDPLYDVAWLGRWNANDAPFVDAAILTSRFGAAPRYRERLACYECFLGLDDLRYYAKTGRRAQYGRMRQHLVRLLARIDQNY